MRSRAARPCNRVSPRTPRRGLRRMPGLPVRSARFARTGLLWNGLKPSVRSWRCCSSSCSRWAHADSSASLLPPAAVAAFCLFSIVAADTPFSRKSEGARPTRTPRGRSLAPAPGGTAVRALVRNDVRLHRLAFLDHSGRAGAERCCPRVPAPYRSVRGRVLGARTAVRSLSPLHGRDAAAVRRPRGCAAPRPERGG
jgi:hypothetical protein